VDGRRHHIIELEECSRLLERPRVEQPGIKRQLGARLHSKRAKEVPAIYAREPSFDESGAALEVEGDRHGGRCADLRWKIVTVLAEPFEQHVASERETGQREGLAGVLLDQSAYHSIEVRRLAGVVEPTCSCHLTVARSEDEGVRRPAATLCERLANVGVQALPVGSGQVRFATYRGISAEDIDYTIAQMRQIVR